MIPAAAARKIRALHDQADRLDRMGFPETAMLCRGKAMLAEIVLGGPIVTPGNPFVGVVKGALR